MKHVVEFSLSAKIDSVVEPLWTLVFKYHREQDIFLSRHNSAQGLISTTQHWVWSTQLSTGFGRHNSALGDVSSIRGSFSLRGAVGP